MRLLVFVGGAAFEFGSVGGNADYPWLISVGALLLRARAGHLEGVGITEAPSVDVVLDNSRRQAARLLGRPLRARAEIYDGDDPYFAGLIATLTYGPTLALSIEA